MLNQVVMVGKLVGDFYQTENDGIEMWKMNLFIETFETDEESCYIEVLINKSIKEQVDKLPENTIVGIKGKLVSDIVKQKDIGNQHLQQIIVYSISILAKK